MIRQTKTENGWVKGLPAADPRITSFKGIPFAAPPVGENRWRAPQPCSDWEGVKECYSFANISVQDQPAVGTDIYCREWHVDKDIPMGEDCLYLNVWTPAKEQDEKLPVLVWFFGGGLQWGYPAEMEFDGERIARRGIVVVSVNYRLGALGFLAHPELTKNQPDAPANFGNLDQQFGVRWVQRNIEAFGGDPSNITIAGQSAGGGSVMAQIASPQNKGLFQKAVIFSGIIRNPYMRDDFIVPRDIEDSEKNGEEFIKFLGVDSIEEARKLDAFFIRDKYAQFRGNHGFFGTVVDHVYLEEEPFECIMNGHHNQVPIIAGNTGDEFPSMIIAESEDEFKQKANTIFEDRAEKFLSFEEAQAHDDRAYAKVSGIECSVKAVFEKIEEQRKAADPLAKSNCYYYRFRPIIPGWDNPGSFHSVDLWFFFETLAKCWRPFKGSHYDLARQMCNYWCNFIKNGDPNGEDCDGEQLPYWTAYSASQPAEMEFTPNGAVPGYKKSEFIDFMINHLENKKDR